VTWIHLQSQISLPDALPYGSWFFNLFTFAVRSYSSLITRWHRERQHGAHNAACSCSWSTLRLKLRVWRLAYGAYAETNGPEEPCVVMRLRDQGHFKRRTHLRENLSSQLQNGGIARVDAERPFTFSPRQVSRWNRLTAQLSTAYSRRLLPRRLVLGCSSRPCSCRRTFSQQDSSCPSKQTLSFQKHGSNAPSSGITMCAAAKVLSRCPVL
jgi:hypothetical protein